MSERLTDEQLDAIEARVDAATEGPWRWGPTSDHWGDCGPTLETVERGPLYDDGSQGAKVDVVGAWGHDAWGILVEEPDADFIAHAREDVPTLLAEARRLRAVEARVRELVDSGDLRWKADGEDIDEAVRDALDGITRDRSGQIIAPREDRP